MILKFAVTHHTYSSSSKIPSGMFASREEAQSFIDKLESLWVKEEFVIEELWPQLWVDTEHKSGGFKPIENLFE